MIKYDLKKEKSKELQKALEKAPKNIEEKINKYIHGEGAKEVIFSITNFTPVSDRNKIHAKDNDFIKIGQINLGAEFKTKQKFAYLIFPNKGIGKNNPVAQEFFEKGLEKEKNNLFENVLKIISNELEK